MENKKFCKDCANFYSTGERTLLDYYVTGKEDDKKKTITAPDVSMIVHCQHETCFTSKEDQTPSIITGYQEMPIVRTQGCAQLNKDYRCPHYKKAGLSILRSLKVKKKLAI